MPPYRQTLCGVLFSSEFELFWCLMLTFLPLVLTFINASLNTIKTMGIIATVPMTLVLYIMVAGTCRGLNRRAPSA